MKSRKQLKAAVILLFISVCGAFYLKVQNPAKVSPEGREVEYQQTEYPSADIQPAGQEDGTAEVIPAETAGESAEHPAEISESELVVHVCGAVRQEGVYHLPAGARIVDAIEAAGGLTGDAAGSYLNQAEQLSDGERIYVPSEEEAEKWAGSGNAGTGQDAERDGQTDGRINLNRAGKEELMTLPGIGESKAEAILTYRKENGSFRSVEELKKVPGIKEGTFSKIEQLITVDGRE